MQKSRCQVKGMGGTKASGRSELCLFQEQEGLGVRGAGWEIRFQVLGAVVP